MLNLGRSPQTQTPTLEPRVHHTHGQRRPAAEAARWRAARTDANVGRRGRGGGWHGTSRSCGTQGTAPPAGAHLSACWLRANVQETPCAACMRKESTTRNVSWFFGAPLGPMNSSDSSRIVEKLTSRCPALPTLRARARSGWHAGACFDKLSPRGLPGITNWRVPAK